MVGPTTVDCELIPSIMEIERRQASSKGGPAERGSTSSSKSPSAGARAPARTSMARAKACGHTNTSTRRCRCRHEVDICVHKQPIPAWALRGWLLRKGSPCKENGIACQRTRKGRRAARRVELPGIMTAHRGTQVGNFRIYRVERLPANARTNDVTPPGRHSGCGADTPLPSGCIIRPGSTNRMATAPVVHVRAHHIKCSLDVSPHCATFKNTCVGAHFVERATGDMVASPLQERCEASRQICQNSVWAIITSLADARRSQYQLKELTRREGLALCSRSSSSQTVRQELPG